MKPFECQSDNLLRDDLDYILQRTPGVWEELRGKRLFITGGTGFFGSWLLESLAWANARLDLGTTALVLSRDPDAFRAKAPHLAANPSIRFHQGDIRWFDFPEGRFDCIIHAAATSAAATFRGEDPLAKFDVVVGGTRRTLDFAVHCGARRLLYTSSGAVYGRQDPHVTHVEENYPGAPDPMHANAAWGVSKRAAEFLCAYYARNRGVEATVARCFSFVGPYLQLDIHYAIGNFIRDGLQGGPITVNGDGTPCRSYLYAADLAVWLWTLLLHGESCKAYNVGAEESISIGDLARTVAGCFDHPVEVRVSKVADANVAPDRYVPAIRRIQEEFGFTEYVGLKTAIEKTIEWHLGLQGGCAGYADTVRSGRR